MKSARFFTLSVFVVGSLLWAAPGNATPNPAPEKQCKKGWVRGTDPGSAFDEDANNWVCVDPETGEVRDDKGQFAGEQGSPQAVDENENNVVCWSPSSGVVTDDEPFSTPESTGSNCPGDAILWPTFACCPDPETFTG